MQYLRQGSTTLFALLTSSSTLVSNRVFATGRRSAFVSYSNNYYRLHQHFFSSVHHQYYSTSSSSQPSPFQLYFAANKGQESTSNTRTNNSKSVKKRKSSTTTTKKKTTTKRKMSKKAAAKNPYKKDDTIAHAPSSLTTNNFDQTRTKLLTLNTPLPRELDASNDNSPCIVYWMMRDCRTIDNWALIFAQNLAIQRHVPLRVVYSLSPPPETDATEGEDGSPPNPVEMSLTTRHGSFLLDGLKIVSSELSEKNVPFDILCPTSREQVGESIVAYCKKDAMAVVCDMSPLRQYRQWTEQQSVPLFESANIPLYQVDAHNIVPVWQASPKREVGARTLRPKINSVFSKYCTTFPVFNGNDHVKDAEQYMEESPSQHDWNQYKEYLNLDDSIGQVNGMQAGHEVAMARFNDFCTSKQNGLKNFDTLRNDPNYSNVCSNLSPWINFGQVSFQRLALDVRALKKHSNGTAAYIEEGVVRRELSDNFVYYTPDAYDSLSGAADWARESLELHSTDEREHLYTWKQLEKSQTHDDLWNAAQLQLVQEGGMHGFLRMYWAKKILEWTSSPAYALATAQYFNDRYAYDGNCPNGFVGVGWSIMGIHDMGWKERPIFGKIRFMNYNGCKRKFKVARFVARYKGAAENAAKATAKSGSNKKAAFIEQISGKKRKA